MSTQRTIAFIFPGQGAQYPGMGAEFFDHFPLAREIFEQADDLLKRPLSQIVRQGPAELLTETRNSQAGIYVTSMAILQVLMQQFPSISPAFCAGFSLGEYSALTAAGFLPFEECLPLVEWRGRYMNEACEQTKGGMAAILGLEALEVEEMVGAAGLPDDLWAANYNCPGQTVISGTVRGLEVGTQAASSRGARRVIPLAVHGAFHSGLMAHAEQQLKPHILSAHFHEPHAGLVMNVNAQEERDANRVKTNLIQQVTHPVRWEQSIRVINQRGVDLYIEIGCGRVLTGFNNKIKVSGQSINVEKVADLEALQAVL